MLSFKELDLLTPEEQRHYWVANDAERAKLAPEFKAKIAARGGVLPATASAASAPNNTATSHAYGRAVSMVLAVFGWFVVVLGSCWMVWGFTSVLGMAGDAARMGRLINSGAILINEVLVPAGAAIGGGLIVLALAAILRAVVDIASNMVAAGRA